MLEYLPEEMPPHTAGVPLRLAPTALSFGTGNSGNSAQVSPLTTSTTSVFLAEEVGTPDVIMTLVPVEPKKGVQFNFFW